MWWKIGGKGSIEMILGYQFSFTKYSTVKWMPRVLIAVLSSQWYPRVRQATVASGNLLQPLTADAGSPCHRTSRFWDWLYQVHLWIGYWGTRSPILLLLRLAPGGAWVKFFSRSSRRATAKCVVGDNYETIFLVVEVRRIAPEGNIIEEIGGRAVDDWLSPIRPSERFWGIEVSALLQFHRLCIGVRFLVADSRSFQVACEMVRVILHAERWILAFRVARCKRVRVINQKGKYEGGIRGGFIRIS